MTILNAVREYHAAGFSIIPCLQDKKPAMAWKAYTKQRASLAQVEDWATTYHSIGVVGGAVSGDIVFIDLDGIPAVKHFAQAFPDLCNSTRSVLTGSQKGIHLYVRVDKLPRNVNVRVDGIGGFEIRATGQYVIAPPSPHPSGNLYRVWRDYDIAHLPDIDDVVTWMLSKRNPKPTPPSTRQPVEADRRKRAYLEKVVSGEIGRVECASPGNRNNSLFYATLRLANYCGGGELSWQDMKSRLYRAALLIGMPENEAKRTIASAYRIGFCNPKRVQS